MTKIAAAVILATSFATSGIVFADDHASPEEENAKLLEQLESANKGNVLLRNRLTRAIANAKSSKVELNDRLADAEGAVEERDELRNRLRRAIANSKSTKSELTERLADAEGAAEERDELRDRLRRAIANSKSTKTELNERLAEAEGAVEERDVLRNRLRRAVANAKSTKAELTQQLVADANWAFAVGRDLQSTIGGLQGTQITTDSEYRVNVEVGNNGLFRTASTILSESGGALLAQIAEQIMKQDAAITVVGHTDNVPVGNGSIFGSNEALSFSRAVSTLQFLQDRGIPVERLSAAGHGANDPIASNDTVEGRRANRRVEIILTPR